MTEINGDAGNVLDFCCCCRNLCLVRREYRSHLSLSHFRFVFPNANVLTTTKKGKKMFCDKESMYSSWMQLAILAGKMHLQDTCSPFMRPGMHGRERNHRKDRKTLGASVHTFTFRTMHGTRMCSCALCVWIHFGYGLEFWPFRSCKSNTHSHACTSIVVWVFFFYGRPEVSLLSRQNEIDALRCHNPLSAFIPSHLPSWGVREMATFIDSSLTWALSVCVCVCVRILFCFFNGKTALLWTRKR